MAAQLGVTKFTIEQWARKSRIPSFKVGRSWKFDEAEVLMALKLSADPRVCLRLPYEPREEGGENQGGFLRGRARRAPPVSAGVV